MRWLAVAAFLLAVAGAIWAGRGAHADATPRVRIVLVRVLPSSQRDEWDVTARTRVRGCGAPAVRMHATARFEGARDRYATVGDGAGAVAYVEASRGDVVRFAATVRCGGSVVRATRVVRVPPATCDGGPLRVLSLRGRATWTDDDGAVRRVRVGGLVSPRATVDVASGWTKLGGPECDDFVVRLLRGRTEVGGYTLHGAALRSLSYAKALVESGDDGAPGVSPIDAVQVLPRGVTCRDCGVIFPSVFSVRARGRRVGVRVYSGRVDLRLPGRRLSLAAPFELWLRCGAASCTVSPRRIRQPREALGAAPPRPRPFLPFVARARPPARALAPARATASVRRVAAGGGEPAQLVVVWTRETHVWAHHEVEYLSEHGVLVWNRVARGWRVAYRLRPPPGQPYLGTRIADVTGDGHADVLVDMENGGTGGCGTRLVLATTHGTVVEAARRSFCEGEAWAARGRWVTAVGVGPCPDPRGSVHCFGGSRRTTFRWDGRRLVPAHVTVRCVRADLDPARECRP